MIDWLKKQWKFIAGAVVAIVLFFIKRGSDVDMTKQKELAEKQKELIDRQRDSAKEAIADKLESDMSALDLKLREEREALVNNVDERAELYKKVLNGSED